MEVPVWGERRGSRGGRGGGSCLCGVVVANGTGCPTIGAGSCRGGCGGVMGCDGAVSVCCPGTAASGFTGCGGVGGIVVMEGAGAIGAGSGRVVVAFRGSCASEEVEVTRGAEGSGVAWGIALWAVGSDGGTKVI